LNHVVLTTGLTQARGREISLRKVVGATRLQLTLQYVSESLLITLFSFVLAVFIAVDFADNLSPLLGVNIDPLASWRATELFWGIIAALLTGFVAAIYPAWQAFRASISGTLQTLGRGNSSGGGALRRGLVLLQSAIGASLLCFAWFAEAQMLHLETLDRGYEARHLYMLSTTGDRDKMTIIKDRADQLPGVLSTAYSGIGLYGGQNAGYQFLQITGTDEQIPFGLNYWNQESIDILGVKLLAGTVPRSYKTRDEELNNVIYLGHNVMVSANALGKAGIPETANAGIGHCIRSKSRRGGKSYETCHRITGVVPDLNFANQLTGLGAVPILYYGVQPGTFVPTTLFFEIDPLELVETQTELRKIFQEVYPYGIFELISGQDQFDDIMRDQVALRTLVQVAAFAIVLMALVGIYSFIRFDVTRRAREIAVRRVLGAHTGQIIWALLKLTGPLLVMSALGGVATGWFAGHMWLERQVLQADISLSLAIYAFFVIAGQYILAVTTEVRRAISLRPSQVLYAD